MSRWRLLTVAALLAIPIIALIVLGSWYLWSMGLARLVWWPLAACFICGYVLAWRWQRNRKLLYPPELHPPLEWTDRDRQAWKIVLKKADDAGTLSVEELCTLNFYLRCGQDLALELARFYHPDTPDPVASLTIPEILAVTELAAADLAETVDQYLPGGHLITVGDWRRAQQVAGWYRTARNVYWLAAAVFSPVNTWLRYMASHLGMSKPFDMLQRDLLAWFYVAFVHRVGAYLVDLQSGRLHVGAVRYRQLRKLHRGDPLPFGDRTDQKVQAAPVVTILLAGQVKAGKSSLVNALVGEQKAVVDVLPATEEIARYTVHPPSVDSELVILDTVGYGHEGPKPDQLKSTAQAARNADIIIMVLHAVNPARQADLDFLSGLSRWFHDRPEFKIPPIIGVLTHIDLLSPALEWTPPYDLINPKRPKEKSIAEATQATREHFGQTLEITLPVCTAAGKLYGVDEWLIPALAGEIDEAHAVAFLRAIHAEARTGRTTKILRQLAQAGKQVARALIENPGYLDSPRGGR
jgi:predicted GTPase